jgi:hypothetical protein
MALNDAAPLYRHAPEAQEVRALRRSHAEAFMQEVLPKNSEATRAVAGNLILVDSRESCDPRHGRTVRTMCRELRTCRLLKTTTCFLCVPSHKQVLFESPAARLESDVVSNQNVGVEVEIIGF